MLDPTGKFTGGAVDRWTWEGVDMTACCGPQGFMAKKQGCSCNVLHKKWESDCGSPPYYTNR